MKRSDRSVSGGRKLNVWGVFFGVLCIVIVGLVVGIVVVKMGGGSDSEVSRADTEVEQNVLSFQEAEYEIFDYYDRIAMISDGTTQEDIQKYVTQTIEYADGLYNDYNDSESRINITIAKVWFLQSFDSYAEEAIRIGKGIENESLSSYQKYLLYKFMGNAYSALGDEAAALQYHTLSADNESNTTPEEDF